MPILSYMKRKPGTGNKGPFEPTIQIGAKKVSLVGQIRK